MALLKMTDITKEFPGVKALDRVSLTVKAGTVHALMGENGAGKSTLMKCLFGVYEKNAGDIYIEDKIEYDVKDVIKENMEIENEFVNEMVYGVLDNINDIDKIANQTKIVFKNKCKAKQNIYLKI